MKKLYCFGIIALGLFFTVNFSSSVQATTNTPSQAEFEQTINPIRDLANNSSQNPKFSSEHQYLTEIIKEADKVLADYSHADSQLISDLMAAAADAYKGCQLIFNAESALASHNATTNTANTPATSAPTTVETATTDTPVIKQKTSVEPHVLEAASTKTPPTTTAKPQPTNIDNIDTAETNETKSSPNSEQLSTITVAQTATLCVTAGALAISNRDKLRHQR